MHTARLTLALVSSLSLALTACSSDDDNDNDNTGNDNNNNMSMVVDADNDGVAAEDDCDDDDASLGAQSADGDCDGVLTAADCDDADAMVGSNAMDMDCDGVATAMDCDDADAMVGSNANDMDCDDVATADDCDDMDATLGATAADGDCDGVLTADDCDDADDMVGSNAMDMDCDGVPTATDCDDMDAMQGSNAMDFDCDGVATADDCDDTDETLGATADDNDCDGTLNGMDDCPDDPLFDETPPPVVNVLFPALNGATNGDEVTVRGTASAVCATTVTSMSTDINGSTAALMITPGAEVDWSFTVTLVSEATNTIVVSATSSAALDDSETVTVVQHAASAPEFGTASGVELDATSNIAYVVDNALPGVYAIDLSDGATVELSGPNAGSGTEFSDPEGGIALDVDVMDGRNRLLVTDNGLNAIVAVDPATGDRTIFSDEGNGGPAIVTPYSIVIDAPNDIAYYVDSGTGIDAVVSVDLTDGERSVFSTAGAPTSPIDFGTPRGVAIDSARNRLLVVDTSSDLLIAVDLMSGARSTVTQSSTMVDLGSPRTVNVDGDTAYIGDVQGVEGIVAVDLTTGDRTELSGATVGTTVDTGAVFGSAREAIVDPGNDRLLAIDSGLPRLVAVSTAMGSEGDRTFIFPATPPAPSVGSGPVIADAEGITVDPATSTVYTADRDNAEVLAINLVTGVRTVVADGSSMGTVLLEPRGIGWDAVNSRLLVPDSDIDGIVAIDPTNGTGTLISDNDSPDDMAGTFGSPRGRPILEPGGTSLLVADTARDSIYRVALSDGERTYFATSESGGFLEGVQSLALDAANDRVFATTGGTSDQADTLLVFDLGTGTPTVLASPSTDMTPVGSGPDMTFPRALAYDAANNRVLVFDVDLDAIVAVSLEAGNARTVISDAATGSGDLLTDLGALANGLAFEPDKQVVYVTNGNSPAVIMVDLTTGDQVAIAR